MSHELPHQVSIVIPTLNAAPGLAATLRALEEGRRSGLVGEVAVVDGGSRDATMEAARRGGASVLESSPGRGQQLAAGAAETKGAWLLFLHADTVLSQDWTQAVRDFIELPGNEDRAAVFRLALDDGDPRARRIERLAHWRGRVLGLPYGDQGLLISRRFYEALGGFRPLPLMEDVDFVRRIGRGNLVEMDAIALTSAARYRAGGWWLRPLRNLAILSLYFLGVSPDTLKRLYG